MGFYRLRGRRRLRLFERLAVKVDRDARLQFARRGPHTVLFVSVRLVRRVCAVLKLHLQLKQLRTSGSGSKGGNGIGGSGRQRRLVLEQAALAHHLRVDLLHQRVRLACACRERGGGQREIKAKWAGDLSAAGPREPWVRNPCPCRGAVVGGRPIEGKPSRSARRRDNSRGPNCELLLWSPPGLKPMEPPVEGPPKPGQQQPDSYLSFPSPLSGGILGSQGACRGREIGQSV